MNDRRRPRRSATQPKLTYPGHIPQRFRTTSSVVVLITPKPRPTCVTRNVRNGGIHENSPHQPNRPKKFSKSSATVLLRYGVRKIAKKESGLSSEELPPKIFSRGV